MIPENITVEQRQDIFEPTVVQNGQPGCDLHIDYREGHDDRKRGED